MRGNHHNTYDDLVKAAGSGCKICVYLPFLRDERGPDVTREGNRPFTTYIFQWWKAPNPRLIVAIESQASWLHDESVGLHISEPRPAPGW
jgi:hypothetical protein